MRPSTISFCCASSTYLRLRFSHLSTVCHRSPILNFLPWFFSNLAPSILTTFLPYCFNLWDSSFSLFQGPSFIVLHLLSLSPFLSVLYIVLLVFIPSISTHLQNSKHTLLTTSYVFFLSLFSLQLLVFRIPLDTKNTPQKNLPIQFPLLPSSYFSHDQFIPFSPIPE